MNNIYKTIINASSFVNHAIKVPFNLLGAKTWSIPEVTARIPLIVFKRIFREKNPPLMDDLFPKKGHLKKRKITKENLEQHLPLCCSAAFVQSSKPEWVEPYGYKVLDPKDFSISNSNLQAGEVCFFDSKSGLKATIIEKENDIVISFGALDSDKTEGLSKIEHSKVTAKGIMNVGRNLLGDKPKIYDQADSFVKEILKHPKLQGKEVTFTGMCYGGTIAQYLALKHDKKALCLNTLPLGPALQKDIGQKKLAQAEDKVVHVLVNNDYVSDSKIASIFDKVLTLLGILTPGNYGRRFVIPSAYEKHEIIKTHNFVLSSIMEYLGYDKRTKPAEIADCECC